MKPRLRAESVGVIGDLNEGIEISRRFQIFLEEN